MCIAATERPSIQTMRNRTCGATHGVYSSSAGAASLLLGGCREKHSNIYSRDRVQGNNGSWRPWIVRLRGKRDEEEKRGNVLRPRPLCACAVRSEATEGDEGQY